MIQSKKSLDVNHCTWLSTKGGGFGKRQYRLVGRVDIPLPMVELFRKIKSSFKEIVYLQPWEKMAENWRKEILTSFHAIYKGDPKIVCGVLLDPMEFLPCYIRRMLLRMKMDGILPEAGLYNIQFKVSL